jgi:DNA repair protein RecN (Recombination protein N)
MLTYINIKNFAIIKELELDLQQEMTVLTGETGAGKSIIIDSLELVLGGRADSSMITPGTDRCEITAMFDLTNLKHVRDLLISQELDSENECIIRRIISSDGRSKSSINGNQCTQQNLRNISMLLANIHGQHESQTLLNPDHQGEILDAFASIQDIAAKVKELYTSLLKIKREIAELEEYADDYPTKIEFLSYQLQELEAIDSYINNLENLRLEQKKFNQSEQITAALNTALNIVSENEDGSVIQNLYSAKNKLDKYQEIDPKITIVIELLQNAIIQAQEASNNIQQNLNSIEFNEEKQKNIEEQLTHIYDLAHKHQTQPQDLPQVRINIEHQLKNLQNITAQIEKAETAEKELEKDYLKYANELSAKRKAAATKLDLLITAKMQTLGMVNGKFKVNLLANNNNEFSSHGLEKIEFLVSTNPGQPLQTLAKVASGGELSRISLAIQAISAEKDITPTLIFDEIDSGIGGRTADIAGQLLRKLAKNTQVLCITHLPQIASQGTNHVLIQKNATATNTEVVLKTLNHKERINEIARMLGGVKITAQTLTHAKEMLDNVF